MNEAQLAELKQITATVDAVRDRLSMLTFRMNESALDLWARVARFEELSHEGGNEQCQVAEPEL